MATSAEVLSALRELASAKQLERDELVDLLQDGIQAALQRRYGPAVNAEIEIDEVKGIIRVVVLRRVMEEVEDAGSAGRPC